MKASCFTLASCAALAAFSSAFAYTPSTISGVTIALSSTVSVEGFSVKDPDTQEVYTTSTKEVVNQRDSEGEPLRTTTQTLTKFKTVRYGNAEILKALQAEGLLPDNKISGWTILAVKGNGEDSSYSFQVVKKGFDPIPLEMSLSASPSIETQNEVEVWRRARVMISNDPEFGPEYDEVEITTKTGSISRRETVALDFHGFQLQGTLAVTSKFVTKNFGTRDEPDEQEFYVDNAFRVTAMSGNYVEDAVAEGSISFAAARLVDFDALGYFTPVEP